MSMFSMLFFNFSFNQIVLSGFVSRSLIHLNLILYRVVNIDLFEIFYMQISSLTSSNFEELVFFHGVFLTSFYGYYYYNNATDVQANFNLLLSFFKDMKLIAQNLWFWGVRLEFPQDILYYLRLLWTGYISWPLSQPIWDMYIEMLGIYFFR